MPQESDKPGPKRIRLGLLGCGTVGQGLIKLIEKHRADLRQNDIELTVTRVAVKDPSRPRSVKLNDFTVATDVLSVVNADDVDLVVEVMGGNTLAVEAGCRALELGKPLVTANKSALARFYPRYAEAGDVAVGMESAAAAHIPILEVLERSLAIEEITLVKGVINGSTNYILTFMERAGCEYEVALADAAAKGFTEADPSLDVEGIDAAEKLTLLALKAFGVHVHPDNIATEGITGITQVDILLANALDHRIKLVAAARRMPHGLSLRVHPALVHRGELLADVDSEFNAIILEGPAFDALTFLGKGAGELPTASAVLNDIVKVARGLRPLRSSIQRSGSADIETIDTNDLELCYFLRLQTNATPDALLVQLSTLEVPVLKHAQIERDGQSYLGVITDVMQERSIMSLLPEITELDTVQGEPGLLRLDKDNYRDIIEREQDTYFGSSLQR
ncbi:homoserine dehydrogenase [Planctomycetota bacterium]|nr:homoserine dehydrogenase [Planctomycetota bacterium]